MTMDIKVFYLNTPMARYEYMRLQLTDMPEDVIAHYKLNKIATPEGYIYCEIQKGMYGLPQAGIIAQQLLEERLEKDGYRQSKTTPGLWTHDTRPVSFSLVVNDFRVKYVGKENVQHLLDTVRIYYKCSCDWKGERYCRLTIKWDYVGRKVHLSMPEYVRIALTRFQTLPRRSDRINHTPTSNQIMGQKSNTHKRTTTHQRSARRGKIHPRGVWSIPVPREGGRWGTTPGPQLSCVPTGKPDRENNGSLHAIFRLHGNTGRSRTHLPSERHGPHNPQ